MTYESCQAADVPCISTRFRNQAENELSLAIDF
jgi:hypothetical protein